jgi:hypothetical protein
MFRNPFVGLALIAAAFVVVGPATVLAGHRPYYSVDFLVNELLYARDDDDREDAAEDLGKIGDPRALPALQQAAIYDEEDDVRDEARKAIRRIESMSASVAPPVVATAPAAPPPAPAAAPAVTVAPAPVVVAPAPVYVVPPPVLVTPAYVAPVLVRPACVPVYPAPVRRYIGFSFYYHR